MGSSLQAHLRVYHFMKAEITWIKSRKADLQKTRRNGVMFHPVQSKVIN